MLSNQTSHHFSEFSLITPCFKLVLSHLPQILRTPKRAPLYFSFFCIHHVFFTRNDFTAKHDREALLLFLDR